VSLFSSFLGKKNASRYFSVQETEDIVAAIREAERQTSGEVRLFIESRCRYVSPVHRAAELFFGLKMDLTNERNGVLVYIAMNDHQYALFADEGIYKEMGAAYWDEEAAKMLTAFKKESYADGIVTIIGDIGNALSAHFPYDNKGNKNELPDEIIFGK
jgi:uncharacterized membrane protein